MSPDANRPRVEEPGTGQVIASDSDKPTVPPRRLPRRVSSPTEEYVAGRERVLSRGHRSWLAGRLLRAAGGRSGAVDTVHQVAELEHLPDVARVSDVPWRPLTFSELVDLDALDLEVGSEVAA